MKPALLLLPALLHTLPAPLGAQTPLNPAPPAPAAPAAGPAAGLTEEMKGFLKQLTATYRGAKSYRDHGRAVITQVSGKVKTTTEAPMALTFSRPNLLRLDAGQYEAVCDGRRLWFAVPPVRQYTLSPAPDALDRRRLPAGSVLGGVEEGHPEILDLLTRDDAFSIMLPHIRRIAWQPETAIAGRPCRVLSWETVSTRLTVFVDRERSVMLRVEGESEPDESAAGGGPVVDSIRMTCDFAPVELNPDIAAEAFAIHPAANFRHMREIGGEPVEAGEAGPPRAAAVLGTKLPEFTGTDLAGKPLEPADWKDRVLLLFFWSASGSEHSLTALPVMQALTDKFAANPAFTVLGINTDQAPRPMVPQLMQRKKAAFRCLTDESFALRRLFKLEGVPTLLLADRTGTVRWAKLGAPPGLLQELEAEIASLLAAPAPANSPGK